MEETLTLGTEMFDQGACLWSKMPSYVPEGGNEGGRGATPTSISILDSFDMKILWFEFGHDIFVGFKMATL